MDENDFYLCLNDIKSELGESVVNFFINKLFEVFHIYNNTNTQIPHVNMVVRNSTQIQNIANLFSLNCLNYPVKFYKYYELDIFVKSLFTNDVKSKDCFVNRRGIGPNCPILVDSEKNKDKIKFYDLYQESKLFNNTRAGIRITNEDYVIDLSNEEIIEVQGSKRIDFKSEKFSRFIKTCALFLLNKNINDTVNNNIVNKSNILTTTVNNGLVSNDIKYIGKSYCSNKDTSIFINKESEYISRVQKMLPSY